MFHVEQRTRKYQRIHVPGTNLCSTCSGPRDRAGRRCRKCHAAYMREHRVPYRNLSPVQKFKSNVRAKANVAQRRGRLVRQPCEICGATRNVEKHHDDYHRPYSVRWLCRNCHADETRAGRILRKNAPRGPQIRVRNAEDEEQRLLMALENPENTFWTKRAIQKRLAAIKKFISKARATAIATV